MSLTKENEELLEALENRIHSRIKEDSDVWKKASVKTRAIKDFVSLGVFAVTLIAGGGVIYKEFQDKPSKEDVDQTLQPLRDDAEAAEKRVEVLEENIGEIKEDVTRVKKVQEYQFENAAWQSEVLDHVAQKKKGKPKKKPESLKKQERDLINNRK